MDSDLFEKISRDHDEKIDNLSEAEAKRDRQWELFSENNDYAP